MTPDKINSVSWITIKTTRARWEAEFMQQILASYDISSRVIDIGLGIYCGHGSQAACDSFSTNLVIGGRLAFAK